MRVLSIPIIDLGARHANTAARAAIARQIASACEALGFLIVTGHGVAREIIDTMVEASIESFRQPLAARSRSMPPSKYVFRGYFPSQASALAASLDVQTPPDLCEVYCVNRFDVPRVAAHARLCPGREAFFFAPNIWPADLPQFKPAWARYYAATEQLTDRLLALMALALDLPESWFVPCCDRHITNLVANYYPPQPTPPRPDQLRRGAHTDYGSVSVLYQTHAHGGLQVPVGNRWLDVPYVPDSFVINLCDLMAVWTNDRWVSTLHRVVNPPRAVADQHRLSLVFFHQPNFDARIECIPTCATPERPPRYAPTTSGDWILAQLTKSIA